MSNRIHLLSYLGNEIELTQRTRGSSRKSSAGQCTHLIQLTLTTTTVLSTLRIPRGGSHLNDQVSRMHRWRVHRVNPRNQSTTTTPTRLRQQAGTQRVARLKAEKGIAQGLSKFQMKMSLREGQLRKGMPPSRPLPETNSIPWTRKPRKTSAQAGTIPSRMKKVGERGTTQTKSDTCSGRMKFATIFNSN